MSTATSIPTPEVKKREIWYSPCVDLSLLLTPGDLVDDDFASWAADKMRSVHQTENTIQVDGGHMTADYQPIYATFQRVPGQHWQYKGHQPGASGISLPRF